MVLTRSSGDTAAVNNEIDATELREQINFLLATVDKQNVIIYIPDTDSPPKLSLLFSERPVLSTAEQDSGPVVNEDANSDTAINGMHNRFSKPSFRSAVLSTVYADIKDKEIRAKNFVISGLLPSKDHEDIKVVEALCETELDVKPVIKSCRRLGKVIPGKVRPLKVSVQTAEQATSVIAAAKKLRIFNDDYVKHNVYINADLTKAQADAAYRVRCQRWQARTARDSQTGGHADTVLRLNADEFVPGKC